MATPIAFEEHHLTARLPELGNADTVIDVPLTIRVDPLLGHTTRIIDPQPPIAVRPDLSAFAAPPRFCPFCADKIEFATGTLDAAITDEGRIRRGSAVVVPNVQAYSEHATVCLYDTERHFLDLPELTPAKVADVLRALSAHARGARTIRPMWHSISANYLPPAGSSVPHPHAQSASDDLGTTLQRRLVAAARAWPSQDTYATDLIEAERGGPRWLGEFGRVAALTPWAPIGAYEVIAIVRGAHDIVDLTDDDCAGLGRVLSGVFATYHALNLTSFNYALYGGGPEPSERYDVLLRVVARANAEPMYRSDVTYYEHLHDEALIDHTPEQVAEAVRRHLG